MVINEGIYRATNNLAWLIKGYFGNFTLWSGRFGDIDLLLRALGLLTWPIGLGLVDPITLAPRTEGVKYDYWQALCERKYRIEKVASLRIRLWPSQTLEAFRPLVPRGWLMLWLIWESAEYWNSKTSCEKVDLLSGSLVSCPNWLLYLFRQRGNRGICHQWPRRRISRDWDALCWWEVSYMSHEGVWRDPRPFCF